TRGLRAYHVLSDLDRTDASLESLDAALTARPLIPNAFVNLPKPTPPQPAEPPGLSAELASSYKQLWSDFVDAHPALSETGTLECDVRRSKEPHDLAAGRESRPAAPTKLTTLKSELVVNRPSFDALNASTKRILSEMNMSADRFSLDAASSRLAKRMTNLTA